MSEIYKLEYFYLFGAFQGVVLVILLLAKARSKANYILVGLITLLSLCNLTGGLAIIDYKSEHSTFERSNVLPNLPLI